MGEGIDEAALAEFLTAAHAVLRDRTFDVAKLRKVTSFLHGSHGGREDEGARAIARFLRREGAGVTRWLDAHVDVPAHGLMLARHSGTGSRGRWRIVTVQ